MKAHRIYASNVSVLEFIAADLAERAAELRASLSTDAVPGAGRS